MKLGNLLFDINEDFLILIFFSNLIWKINLNNTFAIKNKVTFSYAFSSQNSDVTLKK